MALSELPEYRDIIETADNPMALWIELHLKFEDLYGAEIPDDNLVRRFYQFARWCLKSPGKKGYLSDAGTAAAYAFYEHLPDRRAVRRDLPRWLTREEFMGLRDAFRYHLTAEEFTEFETEFLEAAQKGPRKWRV